MQQLAEGSILAHDVLGNMVSALDNKTLALLYAIPAYQDRIRQILSSQQFWYERSIRLVRKQLTWNPDADWGHIYYILENVTEEDWKKGMYIPALDNLDALLILEGLYGKVDVVRVYTYLLSDTRDIRVLNYLLDSNPNEPYDLWTVLRYQTARGDRAIIDKLLSLLPPVEERPKREILTAAGVATGTGDVRTLDFLLGDLVSQLSIPEGKTILIQALDEDRLEVYKYAESVGIATAVTLEDIANADAIETFKYVYEKQTRSAAARDRLIASAVDRDSERVFSYLTSDIAYTRMGWEALLKRAITNRSPGVARQIVAHIPDVDGLVLIDQLAVRSQDMIAALLLGPNSNPVAELRAVLENSQGYQTTLVQIILADPRVRTEDMDTETVTKIAQLLRVHSDPIVGNDIYSLVIRELVFKQPDDVDLVDWMMRLNRSELAEAATAVLDGAPVPESLVPMRSLMLAMLYPTLTRQEQLRQLKDAGASSDTLAKTDRLLFERSDEGSTEESDEEFSED